ncbi:MAG: TIGR00282 family metallophosphoesterase [Dehalococcoidia bacterium]|nr:MAG: TIGR00282 family metallophosphoesterase [Dehalococcoidia bacterium]
MRVLGIGDVIGKPGRRALAAVLPKVRQQYAIDIVVANGENLAGGLGITISTLVELYATGVDVVTSGNHVWHHREILDWLEDDHPLVRPLNYPPAAPGRGYHLLGGLLVVNLIGRTFMAGYDCPFRTMDDLLSHVPEGTRAIVVDFHAEATSEKVALGRYLDGRVSAVLGTHTHVGTIDARVLPGGTAYVTDIGMVGPRDSVIGDDTHSVIQRFLTQIPSRLSVGKGPVEVNATLVSIDDNTGLAVGIERLQYLVD